MAVSERHSVPLDFDEAKTTTPIQMLLKDGKDERSDPSFELVLEELGPWGKFQIGQICCICSSMFLTTFTSLSFIFLGYEPPHVCSQVNETHLLSSHPSVSNDSTATIVYRSCDIRILTNRSGVIRELDVMNCPNGRDFPDAEHTTFLSEWDLVCESSGIAELTPTFFNVGQIFGGVFGSQVTDRTGRRPVLILACLITCITEVLVVACPNIVCVYGVKFVSGIFRQIVAGCFGVYAMEFVTPKQREAVGFALSITFAIFGIVIGAAAYFLRSYSWVYFQACAGFSILFVVIYPFALCESPRWLAANDRTEEALVVLERACKTNGKDFDRVKAVFDAYVAHAFPNSNGNRTQLLLTQNENPDAGEVSVESEKRKSASPWSLLRHRALRGRTLICCYLFLANTLTYFGLFMTSSNLAGDRFLNFSLMNVVQIPSCFCILVMMKRMSRRRVSGIFTSLAALTLLVSVILAFFASDLDGSDVASTVLFVCAKFSISSSLNVVYIVIPELYPTNLRITAAGFTSAFSRLGQIIAPFLRPLFNIVKWGPALIFTVMCAGAVFLIPLLPETKDADLIDTLDDVRTKQKGRKTSL